MSKVDLLTALIPNEDVREKIRGKLPRKLSAVGVCRWVEVNYIEFANLEVLDGVLEEGEYKDRPTSSNPNMVVNGKATKTQLQGLGRELDPIKIVRDKKKCGINDRRNNKEERW